VLEIASYQRSMDAKDETRLQLYVLVKETSRLVLGLRLAIRGYKTNGEVWQGCSKFQNPERRQRQPGFFVFHFTLKIDHR
jgi:hypothetical protein